MRRLARYFFTIISVLSLLLCMATVVLWVRSYWLSEAVLWTRPNWSAFILTADGEARLEYTTPLYEPYSSEWHRFEYRTDKVDGSGAFPDYKPGEWQWFRCYGFALVTGERWGDYHHALFLPIWFIFLVTSLMPLAYGRRRLRLRSSTQMGCCITCSYDLRASPERCPECGTVQAK